MCTVLTHTVFYLISHPCNIVDKHLRDTPNYMCIWVKRGKVLWLEDRIFMMGYVPFRQPNANKALESGMPLRALGKELLMEPDWIKKIELGNESEFITEMRFCDQDRLVIPRPMWRMF